MAPKAQEGNAAAAVQLPFHRIAVSDSGRLAVLLSASRAILVRLAGQSNPGFAVLGALVCPTTVPAIPYSSQVICFPRHAAISPDDRFVALVGDDKVLHVWDVAHDQARDNSAGTSNLLEQGRQVLIRPVPKRANTIFWENTSRHVVIGDRFGDVRAFSVEDAARGSVEGALAKLLDNASAPRDHPRGISRQGAKEAADSDEEDGDDPQDPWAAARVGHASMLTAMLLVGSSPAPHPASIASHIITADRDEHIRVSRWGPARAGWVVENYLLGSDAFIGALAMVSVPVAERYFGRRGAAGTGLLVASDGGRKLRVWDYLQSDSSAQLVASVDVSLAILPHALISGKGSKPRNPKRAFNGKGQAQVQDEHALATQQLAEENSKLAITQLIVFEHQEQPFLLFTAEGCKAFFTLPISALEGQTQGNDVSSQVQATPVELPILDLGVQADGDGHRIWVALDTTFQNGQAAAESTSLQVFSISGSAKTSPVADDGVALLEQLSHSSTSTGEALLAKDKAGQVKKFSATYYDAVNTNPKLAGESISNSSLPMTAAGVLEINAEAGTVFAKRKENMDRIRAAAQALDTAEGAADRPAPRKKVKTEPKEEKVFEIFAMDEQVGGGPRRKGKGKEATSDDAEVSRDVETNDAEEVEVEVSKETDVVADAGAASGAGTDGSQALSMEERMAKLKELRKKMSDSARANRKDVIAEQARRKNGGQARDTQKKSYKLQKAEKILEERDLRESGEDVERARAWGYSIEDNEAWEKKLESKEDRRDKGPVDFNTAAERSYQRQVRQLKPDLKEYERTMEDASAAAGSSSSGSSRALIRASNSVGSLAVTEGDTLSYGTHKPSEAALERLASHINNEHEVRANRSRKRPVDPDAEVTYINEKNRRFNEKAERFFGKYTKEIRDSFERGTAL